MQQNNLKQSNQSEIEFNFVVKSITKNTLTNKKFNLILILILNEIERRNIEKKPII